MNTRPANTNESPINEVAQAFREVTAALARCHDARAQTVLSLFRTAACGVLEAHEQPPAERNLQLVQVSYDYLIELRERMAHEAWFVEADILTEPLTCVSELIDIAAQLLPENPQP